MQHPAPLPFLHLRPLGQCHPGYVDGWLRLSLYRAPLSLIWAPHLGFDQGHQDHPTSVEVASFVLDLEAGHPAFAGAAITFALRSIHSDAPLRCCRPRAAEAIW